ncbi:MAG: hypothetical protein K2Q32_06805, partial [Alphaproteobacteria bacterium]|nr:hypothetical protein [Alphaproteobacteria bacterium]
MVAMVLCLSAFAGKVAHAQAAQTVEQAVGDVDAAYQASPTTSPSRKLFHPNATKAKSTKKSSKDFVEVHKPTLKSLHKVAPQKPHAAVEASDLMDGMRESLDPNTQVLVPANDSPANVGNDVNAAQTATASATVAAVPAGQHAIQPLSSGKLFHPAKPATRDANAVADTLPDVTAKTPAAAMASPTALTTPTTKPAATIDQPVKEQKVEDVKKDDPKKDASKTGAPLLSELDAAPSGAEDVKGDAAPITDKPVTDKKVASEPAAKPEQVKEATDETAGFSKPRPLFSAISDKRKRPGIKRVVTAASSFSGSSIYEPLPDVTAAPNKSPVAETAREPMIKPVASVEAAQAENADNKKSIWAAPDAEMTKGKVLFSQTADGVAPASTASTTEKAADKTDDKKIFTPAEPDEKSAAPVATEEHDNIKSVIDASCGSANNVGTAAAPKNNLCAQGNATSVIGSGPFMWTCQSANGNKTVDCI